MIQHLAILPRPPGVVIVERLQRRTVPGADVAHSYSNLGQLAAIVGQHVRFKIEHDLQPMLELTKQIVVVLQLPALVGRQRAGFFEPGDRIERVARTDFRDCAAVKELQELNHKFNIADATMAGFNITQVAAFAFGAVLDPAFERFDTRDIGEAQVLAIDPRFKTRKQFVAEITIPRDRARFHEGLPFPGAAFDVVVRECAIEAHADRAVRTIGAKTEIDAVGTPEVGGFGEQSHNFLGQALEVFLIRYVAASIGLAIDFVQKNEIDVARIVELDTTQLAEPEDAEAAPFEIGPQRRAVLFVQMPASKIERGFDDGVSKVRDLTNDGLDRLVANDVAVGDTKRFATFEPPERGQHFVVVAKRANFVDQFVGEREPGDSLAFGHSQQVVGFFVGNEQVAKVLAGRKNLQQAGEGVRIALKQGGRRHRIARGRDEPFEVVDRHVGIGEQRRGGGKLLADLRQQVERHAMVGHAREVGVGGGQIGHAQSSQPRLSRLCVFETGAEAVDVDHDSAWYGQRRPPGRISIVTRYFKTDSACFSAAGSAGFGIESVNSSTLDSRVTTSPKSVWALASYIVTARLRPIW